MRTILALTISLFSLSAYTAPVVLTFEDAVFGGMSTEPETMNYRGYSLTTEAGFERDFGPGPALFFCPGCSVTMREESNTPFSLSSFDFYSAGGPATLTLIGGYAGGGTITEQFFPTDRIWNGISLGSQWTNLEYVVFDVLIYDAFVAGLDNVALTAVPVPAAVWLFGSGLGLLGWMRRRRT
jgi:hypothetical protein